MLLFTKDWPLIYEVYNKKDELSIQIIGEANVYDKIKTTYKVELNSEDEATEFYKLLKALFILQTEIPNYFDFKVSINEKGRLEFYLDNQKIEYKHMVEFLREQYKIGLKRRKEIKSKIRAYNKRLKKLQELSAEQEIEYLAKEKQISTFLECKKTFFGKVKYYFKYSKKSIKTIKQDIEEKTEEVENNQLEKKPEIKKEKKKIPIKKVYTLEEIITSYKELEELEDEMKNLLMDINALKLKTKNMAKKIENASKFIEEIDSHKKSIFEFWKYSNKDEVDVLPEGEEEEINVIKKVEKTFNYIDDFEEFGKKLDRMQRRNLDREDTDSVFIATTNLIDILNKIKTKHILVIGLGGVGSYVVESLIRSGIENITIVDFDKIDISNLNRQLMTNLNNIGKLKTDEIEKRILMINKNVKIKKISKFINEDNYLELFKENIDYLIDAEDSTNTKKLIIKECLKRKIKFITCCGTGNKLDPSKLEIVDIRKTSYDPLAKSLRTWVNKEKIKGKILCCCSKEMPIKVNSKTIGSTSFVPSSAGLLITSYVIKDIIK